jgi:hypothetical protein
MRMAINEKNPSFTMLLDEVSTSIAESNGKGMARSDALAQDKCASCSGDATTFRDDTSRQEYPLTAWCQKCQDNFFGADCG